MTRKIIFSLLALCLSAGAAAQSLTLKQCVDMARQHYPAARQYGIIELSRDYTMQNALKSRLPQVNIAAGALAFTDIADLNGAAQTMVGDTKNYMLGASLTVTQSIYDGGKSSANKRTAAAQAEVEARQLDAQMYAVDQRVEDIYFGVLLLDAQLEQNALLTADLQNAKTTIESMISGGVANRGDLLQLMAEMERQAQQRDALTSSRAAYISMLALFIGQKLQADGVSLQLPSAPAMQSALSARPELAVYDAQDRLTDEQHRMLNVRLRPTFSFFGLATTHTNAVDLFHHSMLAGGVTLAWNIGALYTRRNDMRKLDLQRQATDSRRSTFSFNTRLETEQTDGSIAALRRQIAHDDTIVALRSDIRALADRKVKAGTQSTNDLISDINAVSLARSQRSLHQLQLLQVQYRRRHILNGL